MRSKIVLRRLILPGAPLALAALMLLHPSPYDDVAGELVPVAGFWTALHAAQFVLFAPVGWAVWLLVKGSGGAAAAVSRVAAAVFVLFYDLGDAVAGIALRRAGAPLPPVLLPALPAFFLTFDHAFPFGSPTFASFFLIVLWLELRWRGRVFPGARSFPGAYRPADAGPA